MWGAQEVRRILAYREPVDLRKSFPGLVGLVKGVLAEDPLSGTVFVCVTRRGTLVKSIYWDRPGFCLFAKRLERGRFRLPGETPTQELSVQVFRILLDGIALGRRHRMGYTRPMTLADRAAALNQAEVMALLAKNEELTEQNADLTRQVEWFKRQLFGRRSERWLLTPDAQQLSGAGLFPQGEESEDAPPPPTEPVKAYQRRLQRAPREDRLDEPGLRCDPSVPVEGIAVPNPDLAGLATHEYEVIGEKVTYRLAQRPGAYVILKYVRLVIKRKATETLSCPPAPPAVGEKSVADVSVLAGLLLDKFRYHLPLYRQPQRLAATGIRLSRATLTRWVHRTAALLEPIYHALVSSILQSNVLAMDETPIKAGRQGKGNLHTGYFWPI